MIAIAALIPLAMLGALIAGVAALAKRNDQEPDDGLIRRIVMAALTFGLTIVTTVGVAMLIALALGTGGGLARTGSADVAQALAMTIVGAPAAYVLWRYQLKALSGPDGRSIVWLLYQAIASLTYSIGTVVALGNGLRFHEFDAGTRSSLAYGIAWGAGWLFHERIRRDRPAAILPGLARAIGGGVGLITVTFGGVALIGSIIEQIDGAVLASTGRLDPVLTALVWTVVGAGVWVWQFLTSPVGDAASRAGVVLGLGVGGGALLSIGGLTALVAELLFAITGDIDAEVTSYSVASVAVGFLVWRYHRTLLSDGREERIARHIVSGLALIGTAIGIGVLVNAGLAALTPAFASANEDELLWGGLASVIVSGPIWWMSWHPTRRPDPDAGTIVQRTYLTVLGGIAGVVGAIALIVLLYQLLEGVLEGDSVSAIVDGVRTPLGFVAATGLVTAYHYRRWAATRTEEPTFERITVKRVTVVGDETVADRLRAELGVRTTTWASAGEGRVLQPEELAEHLRALDATDVLVVEEDRGYRVIRLAAGDQRPQSGEPQE